MNYTILPYATKRSGIRVVYCMLIRGEGFLQSEIITNAYLGSYAINRDFGDGLADDRERDALIDRAVRLVA